MDGIGTFTWRDGEKYEGEFENGIRKGKGKYTPAQSNEEGLMFFEGEYENDQKNGTGRMVYEDHSIEGRWKNGLCSL